MIPYIEISQGLLLPTYFLVISLVAILGLLWSLRRGITKRKDPNTILDLYLALMIGAALGSRIVHAIWEAPDYYRENPLKVFAVWEGGFVFYGGALGAIATGLWLARRRAINIKEWLDFFAPVGALTYSVGRVGCLLAGCCYGKISDLPWAIHLHSLGEDASMLRHPTQIYASLTELAVLYFLLKLETLNFYRKQGRLFFSWIIMHGLGRLFMEYYRDDDRGLLVNGFAISWHFSIGLILIGSFWLIFSVYNDRKN